MRSANLTGAILSEADLSNANLSGAELAGADFTGANVYGTIFTDAKNVLEAKGLDRARNRDKAIF
ncbi:MAG: pentapeptide repeat-containing protein [Proteobacteria bacterium]|nr:pentapeptide repeat-containing protein [Pseudomonadota bacterium]